MDQAAAAFGGVSDVPRTPVRTCVGCRRRDAQAALLRVVASRSPSDPVQGWELVPDPRQRRPGRGAYVHPDLDCLQLAVQRKAFGRTLRQDGRPDAAAVEQWLRQQD